MAQQQNDNVMRRYVPCFSENDAESSDVKRSSIQHSFGRCLLGLVGNTHWVAADLLHGSWEARIHRREKIGFGGK